MKHLLDFQSLLEKYSLNEAVDELSQEVIEFILDKFDWWLNRKGLANYSEIHHFKPKNKSLEFPVLEVKIKTVFVVVHNEYFTKTGAAHYGYDDKDKMSPKIKKGGIVPSIEIKIYVPVNKKSFERDKNKKIIEDVVVHELTHSFQYYRDYLVGKLTKLNSPFKNLIKEFSEIIYETDFFTLYRLLAQNYIISDKYEISAYLSEIYTRTDWVKSFYKLYKMSYDELFQKIQTEIKKSIYPEDEVVDVFNDCAKDNGMKEVKDLNELVKFLYDHFSSKKEFIFRKISKAGQLDRLKNI